MQPSTSVLGCIANSNHAPMRRNESRPSHRTRKAGPPARNLLFYAAGNILIRSCFPSRR